MEVKLASRFKMLKEVNNQIFTLIWNTTKLMKSANNWFDNCPDNTTKKTPIFGNK